MQPSDNLQTLLTSDLVSVATALVETLNGDALRKQLVERTVGEPLRL